MTFAHADYPMLDAATIANANAPSLPENIERMTRLKRVDDWSTEMWLKWDVAMAKILVADAVKADPGKTFYCVDTPLGRAGITFHDDDTYTFWRESNE